MAAGSTGDPWVLKTPEYTMYRDDDADPALLICQVGSTKLTDQARAIDDLVEWLKRQGDWVPLGSADEARTQLPPLLEQLGLAEVTHDARNNQMRAKGK
jgi:hypothetical protein